MEGRKKERKRENIIKKYTKYKIQTVCVKRSIIILIALVRHTQNQIE